MLPGSPGKSRAFKTVSHDTLYGFDNGKFPNLGLGVLTSG